MMLEAEARPVLAASGLVKRYGAATVVSGLDLQIRKGECFGLLGPNGAGKTTTLRMVLGLVAPDAGAVNVLDWPVPEKAREMRARVGVVPQFDNLDPDFSVQENLEVFGGYFGLDRRVIGERMPDLLAFAGLEGKARAPVNSLSGGMKRRLTLARALINEPDFIILDEPTTGLDPQARHLIWQRLRKLVGEGRTLLLTTHFMEEAERLCDRLAIMDAGRIIAEGAPRALIETHVEKQVVEVFGEDVLVRSGELAGRSARVEWTGETLFCYVDEADDLVGYARSQGLRYLARPANLEDVFLRLTGRDLRD